MIPRLWKFARIRTAEIKMEKSGKLFKIKGSFDRRVCLFGLAGGFLFAVLAAMGASLKATDSIWHKETFLRILGLFPIFWALVSLGLVLLSEEKKGALAERFSMGKEKLRRWYLLCWLFLFLSWIPTLLASWPGIYSYDCGWQLASFVDGQVTGHHPILHTFLLGGCMRLGQAFVGSNQGGALIYSLIQMLLMSAMYAWLCLYLKKKGAPKWLLAGSFLFLAFHPVNSLMALCATKDSLFTAFFAVFLVQLSEALEDKAKFFGSASRQIFFCLNVCLMFAFRNNAFHAFLLCLPFFLWSFRNYWKRMGLLLLLCLGFQLLYTGPVYKALEIEPGDPREMCSVLMQSAARVYNLDYQGLTEEEREGFLSIIREEGMNSYLSWFADPVKAHFNGKKFAADPREFMEAWFSAGMRHKKIYLDAFLANTYGYWYPGDYIVETSKGKDYFEYACKEFREDVDVTMEPKLPALSEFYRKLGNEASFAKVPLLSYTFWLGTYTWLILFALLLLLYRRQYGQIILLIPLLAYFATNLLGPVVKMRYHYPLMACAPLVVFLIWRRDIEWTK